MSLIISIRTYEGIVMASDSRATSSINVSNGRREIHFSDTSYKTFCLGARFGISTCGDAQVRGRSIAHWMRIFEKEQFNNNWSVLSLAQNLGTFFAGLKPAGGVVFHIAGYEVEAESTLVPATYRVYVLSNGAAEIDPQGRGPGALWDGETETLSRLIKGVLLVEKNDIIKMDVLTQTSEDENGNKRTSELRNYNAVPGGCTYFPSARIDFDCFTIQDAVDFAKYAIKTTIETIKFKAQSLTVSEPIDILVIDEEGAHWLARKELHA